MPATIARWGNSAGVRIPAEALRKSGLKVGDLVEAEARPDHSIVIRGVKPHRTRAATLAKVAAMIASIEPSTVPDAAQFDDSPAGGEVW
jgi:antitoxin component of MazEF toxin-antitoxin module